MAFIGANYNRCLWIYKITRFRYFVGKEWVVAMVVEWRRCWYKDLNVPRSGEVVTKIEQAQTRGEGGMSKFWSFCENVIIQWLLNNLAAKLNRANAMLSKIGHFEKLKTLKSIYHAIFKSHLNHLLPVWSQNANSI